jgi:hypothetical protein
MERQNAVSGTDAGVEARGHVAEPRGRSGGWP